MTVGPELSPDMLEERRGVRRLNRVPLLIAGLMLLLILAAVTYTYQMRLAEMQRTAREAQVKPEAANPSSLFRDAPDGGFIPAKTPEPPPPPSQIAVLPPEKPLSPISERDPYGEAWERYRQEQERLAQQRNMRMLQAIGSPTRVQGGTLAKNTPAKQDGGESRDAAQPQSLSGQFASLLTSESARQRRLLNSEVEEDLNRAAEKRAFLTDREPQTRTANTLAGGREAPLSPYEVKAGTVIPAIMVGGVNSDLPGQLIGQVAENVYDTATGRYILIPQGSKLVGTYDNAVTTGQSRVLVAWTRIIYPDASSIDLGKMPGADQSGFAGFKDKVDNHFWQMFSSALLMSVFSAGAQISQGGSDSGNNGQSAQQTIAAGLGQQLGQLGQELARRNARIQPTLEIRPGYRFTVMVTMPTAKLCRFPDAFGSSYEEITGASRHSFSSFTPTKGMPPLIAGRKSNAGDNLCALSFSYRKQNYADTERLESLLFLRLYGLATFGCRHRSRRGIGRRDPAMAAVGRKIGCNRRRRQARQAVAASHFHSRLASTSKNLALIVLDVSHINIGPVQG